MGRGALVVYRRDLLRELLSRGAPNPRRDFLAAQQSLGFYCAQNHRSNATKRQPDVGNAPVLYSRASGKAHF